ncbi:MAG: substrate-binding domain-containing protein [Sporomusaceae bacterium]|nr:substrate-binding domain-containing protein [Sporomusaceae bacterium]
MKLKLIKVLSFMLVVVSSLGGTAFAQTADHPAVKSNEKEVTVMCSGGFYSTLQELAPIYEKKTGKKVILISGSSMGSSPTAIPARLQRGEKADVIIMAGTELDKLAEEGLVVSGSHVDLVLSKIGMCVPAGAPKPDISTTGAFIQTLRNAKSIGYSASASGTYLSKELFPRLGIWNEIKDKTKMVVKDRVASRVAAGEFEIGFQQVSEILPIPGIDFVGTIPDDIQKVTIFSAGIAAISQQSVEGNKLIEFLTSSDALPIIKKQGLEAATH